MNAPNFFVGLPFTSEALDRALEGAPPPSGFRRFVASDRHFTVAFLGACSRDEADAAWAYASALALPRPWPISLGAVVPMGNPRRYSALSALVVDGREPLEAWMGAVRDPLLAAAGRPPETRAAKAHLTVARPQRRATERERAAGLAWADALDLREVRGTLDRIALYTWSDDRAARLFEVVAERALTSQ